MPWTTSNYVLGTFGDVPDVILMDLFRWVLGGNMTIDMLVRVGALDAVLGGRTVNCAVLGAWWAALGFMGTRVPPGAGPESNNIKFPL